MILRSFTRRFRRRARLVTVTAAMTATLVSVATPAAQAQTGLPPIGAEIPMSCLAINSVLTFTGETYAVDFRGGLRERVDVNPDDPINSVRLRSVGFRMSAELPGTEGTAIIEQNDVDVDPQGILRLLQRFPPRYENLQPAITVDLTLQSPGGEPTVLVSKGLFTLQSNRLTQYPPRGDLYQLNTPVDFVNPDEPDTTVATITKFPAKCGGL